MQWCDQAYLSIHLSIYGVSPCIWLSNRQKMCFHAGSNHGPSHYKCDALPLSHKGMLATERDREEYTWRIAYMYFGFLPQLGDCSPVEPGVAADISWMGGSAEEDLQDLLCRTVQVCFVRGAGCGCSVPPRGRGHATDSALGASREDGVRGQ